MSSQSVLATEQLRIPGIVTSIPDLTGTSPQVAFTVWTPGTWPPDDPVDADWNDAAWDETSGVAIVVDVGPFGVPLDTGRWAVWWRVEGADPLEPVFRAGVHVIT